MDIAQQLMRLGIYIYIYIYHCKKRLVVSTTECSYPGFR